MYKEITSYRNELTSGEYDKPFSFNMTYHDWQKIEERLLEFLIKNDSVHEIKPENAQNLMEGTLNLINRIIQSQDSANPISVLIFMDKSARPAAHIFRVTWDMLQRMNKIGKSIKKPKIKFINVGIDENYKHKNFKSLSMLYSLYPEKNLFQAGVLLVDEWVNSGGSIRRASKSLFDVFGIHVPAMANFYDLPRWYNSSVKGITDRTNIHDDHLLYLVMKELDRNTYDDLQSSINDEEKLKQKISIYSKRYSELQSLSVKAIADFFKTKGGFLALRDTNKFHYQRLLKHRQYLTKMVELTAPLIEA